MSQRFRDVPSPDIIVEIREQLSVIDVKQVVITSQNQLASAVDLWVQIKTTCL